MRTAIGIWIFLSLCWIASIAFVASQSWPHLSLDLSASDPQTQAAYDAAVTSHVVFYSAAALIIPLVVLIAALGIRHLAKQFKHRS